MEHIRRNERLAAMTRILVGAPNEIFSLSHFCDAFGAAKSTISEDLDIVRATLDRFSLGALETMPGAAGGVRFRPVVSREKGFEEVRALCDLLGEPGRVLPGDLLYLADIIADPAVIGKMGMIVATEFFLSAPDFVLTMETQGIPLALMTAQALKVPALIARRSSKAYEGPAVHLNYLAGTQFRTMSLPKRLVKAGQRALLVDDVLRTGGTAMGMMDLMREFSVEVVGCAMLIGTEEACARFADIRALMVLETADGASGTAKLRPGDWLKS